jgi:hypothetical protein
VISLLSLYLRVNEIIDDFINLLSSGSTVQNPSFLQYASDRTYLQEITRPPMLKKQRDSALSRTLMPHKMHVQSLARFFNGHSKHLEMLVDSGFYSSPVIAVLPV